MRAFATISGSVLCALASALACGLGLGLAACDPVHSDAMAALGDEAPNVRKGPLHRPGQPCTTCHDGELGDPPLFSVAGTIFLTQEPKSPPAVNATVALTSSDGKTFTTKTNAAGNFYVQPSEFTPQYPMYVAVTSSAGITVKMTSEIGRDASCAKCHTPTIGPTSAGPVFIPAADAGTP